MAAIMYSGSRGNSVLAASDITTSIARVPSSIRAILIFLRYRDSSPGRIRARISARLSVGGVLFSGGICFSSLSDSRSF